LRIGALELLIVVVISLVVAASRLRLVERARGSRGMVRTTFVHGVLAGKLAQRDLLVIRA
jgi:hypothetical protein